MRNYRIIGVLAALFEGWAAHGQGLTKSFTDGTTPELVKPGSPAGSYSLSGFESVNLYNGGLNLRLPLITVGGRGESGYQMTLPFHQTWSVQSYSDSNYAAVYAIHSGYTAWHDGVPYYSPGRMSGRVVSAFGPRNGNCVAPPTAPGRRWFDTTLIRFTFVSSDGTEYEFYDRANDGRPLEVGNCAAAAPSHGTIFSAGNGSAAIFVLDSPPTGGVHTDSGDTSYVIEPTGTIIFRDGLRYRINAGRVDWILDRNGNKTSLTYGPVTDFSPVLPRIDTGVTSVTDPLGRTVTVTYATSLSSPCDQINYSGFGGAGRILKVCHTTLASKLATGMAPASDYQIKSLPDLFPKLNIATPGGYSPLVVSTVILPNNKEYSFHYNNHAEVARIELPTGGKIEYSYGAGNPVTGLNGLNGEFGHSVYLNDPTKIAGVSAIYRRIIERRTYAGGAMEGKTLYSPSAGTDATRCPGILGTATLTVTADHQDAAGTTLAKERHSFCGNPGDIQGVLEFTNFDMPFSRWREGQEYLAEQVTTGGTVLRKTSDTWQQRASVSWWTTAAFTGARTPGTTADEPARDSRIVQSDRTLESGQVSREAYTYDQYTNRTGTTFFGYGNTVPGLQIKRLKTTFSTTATHIADNRRLVSLPQTEEVFDAADVLAGKTVYEYDDYPSATLTDRVGIQNHDFLTYHKTFTVRGNVTATNHFFSASNSIRTRQEYDIAGNVVKRYDGRDKITTLDFAFTPSGCTLTAGAFGFATKITDALSRSIEICPDRYLGKPVRIVAPAGPLSNPNGTTVTTLVDYTDPLDRVKQVTRASGATSEENVTAFIYDDTPGSASVMAQRDLLTSGDGKLKTQEMFDGLGRVKESRSYETASTYISTSQTYDGLGRPWQKSNPYRSGDAMVNSTTSYDLLGRAQSVSLPGGAVEQFTYAGSRTNQSDPAGRKRTTYVDALGRLTKVIEDPCLDDASGQPSASCGSTALNYTTEYLYDALDNLTKVAQGSQTPREFRYDWLKRMEKAKNPESGVICYGAVSGSTCTGMYDGNGNLLRKTDGRNVVADYAWDDLNRPLTRTYSDGTPAVMWTWDTVQVGSLTSIVNSASATSLSSYDRLGRPATGTQVTTGGTYNFGYQYNRAGGVKEIVYPGGRKITYSFDDAGRVSGVTGEKAAATTPYASGIGYAAHQAMRQMTFGTGSARVEQRCFNARLQTETIRVRSTVTDCTPGNRPANSDDLLHLEIGFGSAAANNGNVMSQAIWPVNRSQNYTYDAVNRLASAAEVGGFSRSYGYDAFGNRWVSASGGLANTFGSGNELTLASQMSAATNRVAPGTTNYDEAGNLIVFSPYALAYDGENRIVSMAGGSNGTMTLSYDGEGRRVKKVWSAGGAPDVTTVYVYDAVTGELAQEYQTGGTVEAAGTSYLAEDWLGSTRLTLDGAGAVRGRFDYLPFGRMLHAGENGRTVGNGYAAAPSGTSGRPGMRRMFTGKERDWETDSPLDYFGARYMSAAQGRFTSPDKPFADQTPFDPQSWNLYSYTRNNPLKYVDRSGEAIETAWDAFNVGIGAVSFVSNVRHGNYLSAAVDAVGVVIDAAATVAPFVPGGAGTLIKAGRLAGKADDLADGVKALNRVDDAADTAKAGKQGAKNFDDARREGFEKAGITNPNDVKFTKVDPKTGTVVEFKGPGGAKVAYDGPHATPGPGHNSPHVGYQSAGKRTQGGTERGNIPYTGPQHPSRPAKKYEGDVEPH